MIAKNLCLLSYKTEDYAMRKRVLQIVSFVILLTLVQVVSGNPHLPADAITYFPNTDWTATTPEEQGMNSTVLAEMLQFVEDEDPPVKGLVVTRNGYIIEEEYWNYNTETTTHHIFSCTKSYTAALVGIADARRSQRRVGGPPGPEPCRANPGSNGTPIGDVAPP